MNFESEIFGIYGIFSYKKLRKILRYQIEYMLLYQKIMQILH